MIFASSPDTSILNESRTRNQLQKTLHNKLNILELSSSGPIAIEKVSTSVQRSDEPLSRATGRLK